MKYKFVNLTMKIDQLLPVLEQYKSSYLSNNEAGKKFLHDKKINILSLVRDVGDKIENNIKVLSDFFKEHAKDYKLLYFENDSIDNTKTILESLEKKSNNIIFKSQRNDRPKFGPIKSLERVKYLAEYRNYLKELSKSIESDYTMVIDSDFLDISTDGLLNSFGLLSRYPHISAIAGNSFEYILINGSTDKKQLWNYDSWAYRGSWWQDLTVIRPVPTNSIDPMFWFGICILPVGSDPVVVNSAFGGCCIYNSRYYNDDNIQYDSYDCEHVCLHHNLAKKYTDFNLFLNPSQRMLFE